MCNGVLKWGVHDETLAALTHLALEQGQSLQGSQPSFSHHKSLKVTRYSLISNLALKLDKFNEFLPKESIYSCRKYRLKELKKKAKQKNLFAVGVSHKHS